MWLAARRRIWTSERRAQHGLQLHADPCHLCAQGIDEVEHLSVQCVYTSQVWHSCRTMTGLPITIPTQHDHLESWWLRERALLAKEERRRLDSWVLLTSWNVWKQQNARVFGNTAQQCNEDVLAAKTVADMKLWSQAGLGDGDGVQDLA